MARSVVDSDGARFPAVFVARRPVMTERVITRSIAADAANFRCMTVPDGATVRDFFALLLSRLAMSTL